MNFARSIVQLNLLAVWQREMTVWGSRLKAPTLDRLLCLALHRLGLMGKEERTLLTHWIRPGTTVVDVGANQGLYTLLFSRLVGPSGRVIAFEPEPEMFAALTHNCRVNSADNVQCFNLALGSKAGPTKLTRSLVHGGDNRIASYARPQITKLVDIHVVTLDEMVGDGPVDFIKMDVQGWELEVFRGMNRILGQNNNVQIYFEFWPHGLRTAGCEPADLLSYLRHKSLSLSAYRGGKEWPINDEICSKWNRERFVNIYARAADCGIAANSRL